jgi:hypothetical protein
MIVVYNRTEDVSWEHFCDWTFYYTHHNETDAPQYVHSDVSSDIAVAWMFYYTYHSDMDAPQNGHVDVLSDYLC